MSRMGEHYIKYLNGEAARCGSCGGSLLKGGAFHDEKTRSYYHPDCAKVWQCQDCGGWTEDVVSMRRCSHCGVER
jgi:hypothetical protein